MGDRRKVREPELGRLLSGRDQPSVLEKEALLEDVLGAEADAPTPKRSFIWARALALGAGVFLAIVFFPRDPEFTSKGSDRALVRPHCVVDGRPAECAQGAKLLVEVQPPKKRPHLALFNRRPDGVIIWYRPSATGTSSAVDIEHPRVLDQSFLIDENHPDGRYMLFAVFSEEAKTRDELKEMLGEKLRHEDLSVVRQTIDVGEFEEEE